MEYNTPSIECKYYITYDLINDQMILIWPEKNSANINEEFKIGIIIYNDSSLFPSLIPSIFTN